MAVKARIHLGLVTLEAESDAANIVAELKEVVGNAAAIIDEAVKAKEIALAKDVFSGGAVSGSRSVAKAAEDGPPADDAPKCKHGVMQDLSSKGYKHRYYCTGPKGDQKDKGCWAKD